jgi:hypothetical protein
MMENLGDMAISPRFSFWKIGKRQPRIIPKGIEGPLHNKCRLTEGEHQSCQVFTIPGNEGKYV